ncbi:MAG: hypothetical protein K9G76_02245 [Bacteroidales bacterium]|nr:hypothetical protein [Bacteroidales bacterium]MCF8404870.1 hypothetical protein [Bacteroidales bacterium]
MGRFALIRKKERWSATWLGNIVKILILLIVVWIYVVNIRTYLAPVEPIEARVLVVEGFITDYAIEESMHIFNEGNYDLMIVTGKKRIKGAHLDHFTNDGEYSAATLNYMGFDMKKLKVVEVAFDVTRDRTYYSALSVKKWLDKNLPGCRAVNLITLGCHGRRSHYLFQEAFGETIEVGIISIESKSYDPIKWWSTSFGFREVTNETFAWIYGRYFFFPKDSE